MMLDSRPSPALTEVIGLDPMYSKHIHSYTINSDNVHAVLKKNFELKKL